MHGLWLANQAAATTRAHFSTTLVPALASAATRRAAAATFPTADLAPITSALVAAAAAAAALAAAAHSSASGAVRGQLPHLQYPLRQQRCL